MNTETCNELSEILVRNNLTWAQLERVAIVAALRRYKRNRTAVCRSLGMSRSRLYRLMAKHEIELDPYCQKPGPVP